MEAGSGKWGRTLVAAVFALAALSAAAAFSASVSWKRRCGRLASRIVELEAQLQASLEKGAAERRGRVRAQQALREAYTHQNNGSSGVEAGSSLPSQSSSSYPLAPIGTVCSCFSTRNGTPRQPLLVPLARACLVLDSSRVPPSALEGLVEYSHCWILYVFHLNTDLEKLWRDPFRSKFKAKVRVPRLEGGKMGVLATRSPHRPCPIGLTVAKVEAVDGHAVLLSGVDLVDGTPVLDIKPYLPYSDCIQGATVPDWMVENNSLAVASVEFSEDFSSSLATCWETAVLSWDIRSLSQRNRPHSTVAEQNTSTGPDLPEYVVEESDGKKTVSPSPGEVTYHLVVEGIDFAYHVDGCSNITVEKASILGAINRTRARQNCVTWRDKFH